MLGALLLTLAVGANAPGEFLNVDGESAARLAWALDVAVSGSREQTARGFLARHAAALGLTPDDELVLAADQGDVLVFERRRAAVAVAGAEVKVTFDHSPQRLVMVHVGPPLPRARGSFLVDVARAEAVAARGLDGVEVVEATRTWRREADALRPTWLVRFTAGGADQPMRALLDAETGQFLYRVSERLSAGMGSVYDFSPAKGGVVTRALGGLPANATTLVGSRATTLSCDGAGRGAGCIPRATANGSGDFVFTPSFLADATDRFGEVNAYYSTDRFSAWLTALDGGVTLPPIDVYTNVGGSNQGFFLGGSTRFAIELGQGPQADWAYEGDVIFHELGHGVVQRSASFGFYGLDAFGLDGEGGSLNEGASDCLALALSGDPVLGEFIGGYLEDAGNLINPYLRRMDDVFTCQGRGGSLDGGDPGRFGQIHDDGRILGSFFWALHSRSQTLGPYAAAAAFVRALRSVNSSAGFNEVALALRQHMTARHGAAAGELVACLQCERDLPGCASLTRRIYSGETHESRLLGDDTPSPVMGNGERPATFQYELAVPASTPVLIDRLAITRGALPKVYARFNQRVGWSGGNPTSDAVITAAGQMLPAQPAAGTWYLQGALTDPALGTRRYGIRAQVAGGAARPAVPAMTCTLGGGVGPCTCTPQCSGLMCGSDGCGGMCGSCDAGFGCVAGACACLPRCTGRACGPDGCGGSCGTCASGTCNMTTGVCEGCMPSCVGKQCGGNGCGQACGQCTAMNEICELATGQCVDAGELPIADAGFDAGTGGSGGGGAEEVRGVCGCGAAPSFAVLGFAMLLLARRRIPSPQRGERARARGVGEDEAEPAAESSRSAAAETRPARAFASRSVPSPRPSPRSGRGGAIWGLMLSLVALCLTGHIDPTHFAGALTEEPADLSNVPVAELTPEQLVTEHKRLDKYRTEFILPVILSAVGAVLVIGGAIFEVVGIFYVFLPSLIGGSMSGLMGFTIAGYVLIALGGAALIAGGILLTIGLIKLFPALSRRRDAMERREEIQKRLDAADPEKQPQAPPMNPGDVRYEGPLPSMLLATF